MCQSFNSKITLMKVNVSYGAPSSNWIVQIAYGVALEFSLYKPTFPSSLILFTLKACGGKHAVSWHKKLAWNSLRSDLPQAHILRFPVVNVEFCENMLAVVISMSVNKSGRDREPSTGTFDITFWKKYYFGLLIYVFCSERVSTVDEC
jgi:hypothetical protein